ncbi:hypothetical protein GCM10008955_08920 [Deinococcus malanensis]|uniref:Uncharacterized protein n=1 Tax=Deinococcus malanensis TaxID=1706855 RepID=A0ABQ2ENR9_9DEIO|nr:hypothetical protein [Deinococcus malanensis]GGK17614.1 hypothetical protein GCM10008955_08920 [Deinococcus malanensis]
MIPGTVYTLEHGPTRLGTLIITGSDHLAVHGHFEPCPEFALYRPLFDEDAALAEQVAGDPDPALLIRAEALLDRILALGLVLRSARGTGYRDFLISIEGNHAGFRPLTPEEEPL